MKIALFKRHGPFLVFDQYGFATDTFEPGDDVARIGHTPAEQKQLGPSRRKGNREFVMHAAHRIAQHLKFIDDKEARTFAAQETPALSLEGRDDDARIEVNGDVAGGNPDIPAATAPFGQFVVGECASRNRENGLLLQVRIKELKYICLAGTGGSLDDNVVTFLQSSQGFLLP